MQVPRFGRLQLKIMQVLWDKGRASARQITDELNRTERVAHSTVQTLLRKLEAKGAVDHDAEDRTFVFYPLVEADKVTSKATKEFVERVFGGSAGGLVAYLLKHERISQEEMDRIRETIENGGK